MRKIAILIFILLMITIVPISAQDDVIQAEFGEVYTRAFVESGEQLFLQFSAEAGDLIYVSGKAHDPGSSFLEIHIRDSVGRDIGVYDDFPIDPYALAEIPADGNYVGVVTFDGPIEGDYSIGLDKTTFLSMEAVTASFEPLQPSAFFAVKVESDNQYGIFLTRLEGDPIQMQVEVTGFENEYGRGLASFRGEEVEDFRLVLNLKANVLYVVRLNSGLSTTTFIPAGTDTRSEFSARLVLNQ